MMYSFTRMMWHHVRSQLATAAFLLASAAVVFGQSAPPTLPDNTVYGRLGTGTGSGPGQAIPFNTLGNALLPYGTHFRQLLTSGLTLFVNGSTGSNSNDCLAATVSAPHGPCLTIGHAVSVAKNTVDGGGLLPLISVAAGTYAEEIDGFGSAVGTTGLNIVGAGSGSVTVQAPSGKYAVNVQDWFGIEFSGITFSCAGGALGEWLALKHAILDTISDVVFTACSGAGMITAQLNSIINLGGPPIFNGSAAGVLSADSNSAINITAGCTITGSPTYSVAFMQIIDSYVEFGSASCTGTFSGLKFDLVGNSWGEANGRSLNSVIASGSNGTMRLGSQDDAIDPPTYPLAPATTTFGGLPTPVAGMIAYMTDGATGNCGDSACTTFGTAVTGGGGSLKLLIWYNNAAWHLIGK